MVAGFAAAPAVAITPPGPVNTKAVPSDITAPEFTWKRTDSPCAADGVLQGSDFSQPPPPTQTLNLSAAWSISRGDGVKVAVIDTGVTPNPRLPGLIGGGDFMGGNSNGLADCDAHGTLVAGIIAGAPSSSDGFSGVAPGAAIISIRQTSDAYSLQLPNGSNTNDPKLSKNAIDVRALARAVVRAANLGAKVINISVTECLAPGNNVDQTSLQSALWYASTVKDAVIVAAAGNTGDRQGCTQNPDVDVANPDDLRNWGGVSTVSSPSVFDQYVLSVGFTNATGQPSTNSLAGPWVGVGAPGTGLLSLSASGRGLTDAVPGQQGTLVPLAGTSFAAAYVSGTAALIRAKYPQLSRSQVVGRILATAHSPAHGVDNVIGYGFIDPLAALTASPQSLKQNFTRPVPMVMPPADPTPDRAPMIAALSVIVAAILGGIGVVIWWKLIARRKEPTYEQD